MRRLDSLRQSVAHRPQIQNTQLRTPYLLYQDYFWLSNWQNSNNTNRGIYRTIILMKNRVTAGGMPNTNSIQLLHTWTTTKYDITQITSGPYKSADAARNTAHEIQQINTFENKWKIKNNKNKFEIIPIPRLKTTDIYIDDDVLRYTTEGKILGITFNSRGITPQIKIRNAIAQSHITKLYRFYNLNNKNKPKLFNALVSSALISPRVIMNTV